MKRVVTFILMVVLISSFVCAYSTFGPITDESSNETADFSETTGSVTGIHPANFRQGNTIAMLILALMGVGLFAVLTYCKRNI